MEYIVANCILATKLSFNYLTDRELCGALSVNKSMWKLRKDQDIWEYRYNLNKIIIHPFEELDYFTKYIIYEYGLPVICKLFIEKNNIIYTILIYLKCIYGGETEEFIKVCRLIYERLAKMKYVNLANNIFLRNERVVRHIQRNFMTARFLPINYLTLAVIRVPRFFVNCIQMLKISVIIEIFRKLPNEFFNRTNMCIFIMECIKYRKIGFLQELLNTYDFDEEYLSREICYPLRMDSSGKIINILSNFNIVVDIDHLKQQVLPGIIPMHIRHLMDKTGKIVPDKYTKRKME